jgi:thiamine biosynthesis protein ThiI
MEVILIRYAELGLKSERVRSRFLSRLLEDVSSRLTSERIEHLLKSERGRIFLETDKINSAVEILRKIPGIYSISVATEAPSDIEGLMDALSNYSRNRLKDAMTFGIKVKKSVEMDISSRDIAVMGGSAVCSHLDEESVRVDLKDPDIWFEIEIRRDHAYLFTERIKGMGGMPSSTQGKVLLYLPDRKTISGTARESGGRALLSKKMMLRRGCRVIPALFEKDLAGWDDILDEIKEEGKDPFILSGDDLPRALGDALEKTGSIGLAYPGTLEDLIDKEELSENSLHTPIFQPTVALDNNEVDRWISHYL